MSADPHNRGVLRDYVPHLGDDALALYVRAVPGSRHAPGDVLTGPIRDILAYARERGWSGVLMALGE